MKQTLAKLFPSLFDRHFKCARCGRPRGAGFCNRLFDTTVALGFKRHGEGWVCIEESDCFNEFVNRLSPYRDNSADFLRGGEYHFQILSYYYSTSTTDAFWTTKIEFYALSLHNFEAKWGDQSKQLTTRHRVMGSINFLTKEEMASWQEGPQLRDEARFVGYGGNYLSIKLRAPIESRSEILRTLNSGFTTTKTFIRLECELSFINSVDGPCNSAGGLYNRLDKIHTFKVSDWNFFVGVVGELSDLKPFEGL